MGISRQERRRAEREAAKAARRLARQTKVTGKAVDGVTPEIEHVFLLKDCVHLTDTVIADLVSRGWPREKLAEFRDNSGHYCPPRDSIIFHEPQGLEITLENGRLMDHFHQLLTDDVRTQPRSPRGRAASVVLDRPSVFARRWLRTFGDSD
ncbi:MAG: hypothetical protein ACT4P8_18380 [Betaproteobacteria bacterium]